MRIKHYKQTKGLLRKCSFFVTNTETDTHCIIIYIYHHHHHHHHLEHAKRVEEEEASMSSFLKIFAIIVSNLCHNFFQLSSTLEMQASHAMGKDGRLFCASCKRVSRKERNFQIRPQMSKLISRDPFQLLYCWTIVIVHSLQRWRDWSTLSWPRSLTL